MWYLTSILETTLLLRDVDSFWKDRMLPIQLGRKFLNF